MGTTSRENAALVRRFLADVVDGGGTRAVEVFVTEDLVEHNLVFGDGRGREGVAALGWTVLAAADTEIEDVVAATDRVAVRATVTGTHRESLRDTRVNRRTMQKIADRDVVRKQ